MASRRQTGATAPRAQSATALVDAGKTLLAQRPPTAISGRELAEAAGVNYGLVHRHFGSKSAVLGCSLDELLAEFAATGFAADGVPVPLRLAGNEVLWRALVHVVIDRAGFSEYRISTPTLERSVLGVARCRPDLDDDQVRAVVGLALSIEVGMGLHRAPLATEMSLRPDDPAIDHLVAQWLDGLYRGHGPLGSAPVARRTLPASTPASAADLDAAAEAGVDEKLVVAGAALLTDRSPSAISGRQLARHAGVNYGLIHHYFGSKDEVLRRSVQLHRDRFFAATSTPEASPRYFAASDHPGYVRAITWAALDPDLASAEQRLPVTAQMVDRLLGPDPSPLTELATRVAISTAIAAQMTWALFLPVMEQGLGTDPRRLEPMLVPLLRDLLVDPMRDTTAPG